VVHSCRAVRARSTSSADWYSAVRFGRMVFVELSSEVRQLRRGHGFSLGACPSDRSVSNDLHRLRTGLLVPHPPYAGESASVRREEGALGVMTDLGGSVATGAMWRRVGAWNSAVTYVFGPLRP
jgi:hypothetical protein